jgi:hypothetical protein
LFHRTFDISRCRYTVRLTAETNRWNAIDGERHRRKRVQIRSFLASDVLGEPDDLPSSESCVHAVGKFTVASVIAHGLTRSTNLSAIVNRGSLSRN